MQGTNWNSWSTSASIWISDANSSAVAFYMDACRALISITSPWSCIDTWDMQYRVQIVDQHHECIKTFENLRRPGNEVKGTRSLSSMDDCGMIVCDAIINTTSRVAVTGSIDSLRNIAYPGLITTIMIYSLWSLEHSDIWRNIHFDRHLQYMYK